MQTFQGRDQQNMHAKDTHLVERLLHKHFNLLGPKLKPPFKIYLPKIDEEEK